MDADQILDCVGLYCPMPIVHTARRIKELKSGQVLEVLSDDKGIMEDLPAWCKTTGNECLDIQEEQGVYHIYVKKT